MKKTVAQVNEDEPFPQLYDKSWYKLIAAQQVCDGYVEGAGVRIVPLTVSAGAGHRYSSVISF